MVASIHFEFTVKKKEICSVFNFEDIGLQLNAIFEKFHKKAKNWTPLKRFTF